MQQRQDWDEAEAAVRILGELTETHVGILSLTLNAPLGEEAFAGLRIVCVNEKEMKDEKIAKAFELAKALPNISPVALRLYLSELVAKGLLHDEGIGRLGMKAMEYFTPTDLTTWFVDWVQDREIIRQAQGL